MPRRVPARTGALVLAAVLLAGGVGQAHEAGVRSRVQAQAVEAADAARAELARRDRSTQAEVVRLEVGFARYAAVRRAQALRTARAAVQAAQAVVVGAAADVPAETVGPLDAATADLAALIEAAAQPVSPSVPGTDGGTDGGTATGTHDARAPSSVGAVEAPPVAAPVAAPVPGALVVVGVPADGAVGAPVPADGSSMTGAPSGAGADDPGASPDAPDLAGPNTSTPDVTVAPDLAVTAEVLAAAHRVTDLSVQVQAAADAAVAAEAARAAAEEAARAAEAMTARRVAVAEAAPNGEIPPEVLCPVRIAPDALLRCDAAASLDRLAEAYRADVGHDLRVVSSYRSLAAQVAVKATRGALAAEPGRSNHGRGLAVDLADFGGLGDFTAPAYLWMKQNAAAFGWHHPDAMEPGGSGPQEPWHWEYGTEG